MLYGLFCCDFVCVAYVCFVCLMCLCVWFVMYCAALCGFRVGDCGCVCGVFLVNFVFACFVCDVRRDVSFLFLKNVCVCVRV